MRIELADGATAYEVSGPLGAPSVVLVHGMSSPSFVWDATVPALARGHRVLRYDLYGRGDSDRPDTRYDLALYLRQLDAMVALVEGPIVLVGFSWGAAIAAAWADRHPSQLRRLVLVAPGGLDAGWGARLLALPGVGERLVGRRLIEADLRRAFIEAPAGYVARVLAQLDRPGFPRVFLSSLRHVPSRPYAALAKRDFAIELMWGTRDEKVPIALAPRFLALAPRARLHPIAGGAHIAMVEQPGAFNSTLLRLLDPARDQEPRTPP